MKIHYYVLKKLVAVGADVIVVDSAHGHSQGIINMVKKIKVVRKRFRFWYKKYFFTIRLLA
ncbi:MAG: IMP dehydrogenase [Spiroplasma phoeniceum]|nr:MAG: IMP dehydrogenase [Spiroplasma phoeniceum]UZQ32061.1 MAG: IMP dehydrogenase [Spiroplasma phoeniceum]